MRRKDIKKVAKLMDEYSEIQPDCFRSLVLFMERLGWQTIEYNDGGQGDQFVERMDLKLSASKYNAFLYTTGGRNIILVDAKHPNKVDHFGHEMGHIFLNHTYSNLTPRDEVDADKFGEAILVRMRRKPKINKYIRYAFAAAVVICIGLLIALILKPTKRIEAKSYIPPAASHLNISYYGK